MKKKEIPLEQYTYSTKNLEGASEIFLDETAPLIGYIVHSFNTLEELLNEAIYDLFHDDCHTMGVIVVNKLNYSAKVDLFKRIMVDMQNTVGKESPFFVKLIEKLTNAGRLRNQVIHADWESAFDDGYTLSKVKINKKGITQEYIQFTPDSLEKIQQLILDTADMFDDYDEEYNNLLQ